MLLLPSFIFAEIFLIHFSCVLLYLLIGCVYIFFIYDLKEEPGILIVFGHIAITNTIFDNLIFFDPIHGTIQELDG
jgi:hypothetical protein